MPSPVSAMRTTAQCPRGGLDGDPAGGRGVLEGVVDQGAQHLSQPGQVGPRPHRPGGRRELHLLLVDQRSELATACWRAALARAPG
jgi:hypothetical protein